MGVAAVLLVCFDDLLLQVFCITVEVVSNVLSAGMMVDLAYQVVGTAVVVFIFQIVGMEVGVTPSFFLHTYDLQAMEGTYSLLLVPPN